MLSSPHWLEKHLRPRTFSLIPRTAKTTLSITSESAEGQVTYPTGHQRRWNLEPVQATSHHLGLL